MTTDTLAARFEAAGLDMALALQAGRDAVATNDAQAARAASRNYLRALARRARLGREIDRRMEVRR